MLKIFIFCIIVCYCTNCVPSKADKVESMLSSIPPLRKVEVNDGLYEYLSDEIGNMLPDGGILLDIGCGSGLGSTKALIEGMMNAYYHTNNNNKDGYNRNNDIPYKLHCIELHPPLCEDLRNNYAHSSSIQFFFFIVVLHICQIMMILMI